MTLQFSPQTRRVFHLSLPIFAELLLQLLVGNMDQFMISHFGSAAVAAIGNGNQVMNVVIIVLTTMSTAATILLTQHIGAGRVGKECSEIVTVAVTVSAVFSFLVGLFLLLEPELVFQLLRTPEDAFDGACLYTRIVGGTVLLQGLYIQLCAVLRSYTLLKEVVVLSVSMNLLNVAGNAILINGFFGFPQMGVAGAAVATVISQVVSAVLCIIKLTRSDGPYRLEIKRIGFDLPLLKKITSQGVPSGVQNSIIAIANVVVQSNINTFGSDAMAGCGSYSKVEGFVFLPITAFAMALTTFIGQNLGAGQFDRAKQGARIGILCSMAMAELIGVALFFLAPYAMRLFNDDPAVVAIGVRQSHIEALFFCFLAFAHGVSAVLRGAGRAQVPMYTMLGCWCILRVSYITLALKVWPDIATIFWAYPITWSVSCVVFLLYYLKADWVHALEKSL